MPPAISTIVLARRQRTSISAYFTNRLTPLTGLGLLTSLPAAGLSRPGSARLGRSQKDGLPSRSWGKPYASMGSRPSTGAQVRGSPVAAPSNRGCPPCRCSAPSVAWSWSSRCFPLSGGRDDYLSFHVGKPRDAECKMVFGTTGPRPAAAVRIATGPAQDTLVLAGVVDAWELSERVLY